MDNTLYFLSQTIIFLTTLGVLAALLFALNYALRQLQFAEQRRKKLVLYIGLGFSLWLALLALLAGAGFFSNFEVLPPRLLIALLPPLVLTIILLFSPFLRLLLQVIPESWLLYIQSFRIVVEVAFWLGLTAGFVPIQMTFEGFNQDIIVGITAPMAAFVFFGRGRFRKWEAVIWNVFGIALLLNILTIAILSTPSPFRVFMNEPANTFVATFPFVWIPGFIVPFALAMHLFSLRQIFLPQNKTVRRLLRVDRLQSDRSGK